jgi:hypothetical protein
MTGYSCTRQVSAIRAKYPCDGIGEYREGNKVDVCWRLRDEAVIGCVENVLVVSQWEVSCTS